MARGYRRKRSYTTPQRILVHLATSPFPPQSASVADFTQEGIGASTHSARTTVTKWLSRLREQGFLEASREHVPGHRVRKTVYRLTPAGWERARSLRAQLEADVVRVETPENGGVLIRVADVPRLFPTLVGLTSAVSLVREGRLDLARRPRPVDPASLLWGDGLRTVDRVFGRSAEIRTLDEWADSRSSALTVVGEGGIGKSTLVAAWVLRRRPRPYVFWLEAEGSMSPRSVLVDIARFLERLGRRGLVAHLAEGGRIEPQTAIRILAADLAGLPALFVFDNVHKAGAATRRLLLGPLLQGLEGLPAKVVAISREPESASTPWGRGSRRPAIGSLRVGGLDVDASMSFVRSKGLAADDATVRRIALSARGHPLLLGLAAQGGAAVSGDLRRYVDREVWRTLSEGERAVLEAAAVFRRAARVAALRGFPGVTESALAGLERKGLLRPTLTEGVVLHDEILDSVRRRMGQAERREAHLQAARYFRARLDAAERTEAIHHLVRAKAFTEAADMLESEGPGLVDPLHADALASILDEVDPQEVEGRVASRLAETHGDCLRVAGRLPEAEARYRLAVEASERGRQLERIPRLLRKIGAIARITNRYEKAAGLLAEARASLAVRPDRAELAEVLTETALVDRGLGRSEDAARVLDEAVGLATEASDPGSLARTLLTLASFSVARGEPARGLSEKLEALRIAEHAGDLTEATRACTSIGATLWELRRPEEALAYHEKALALATLVGNLRLIACASFHRAATLLDLGRPSDAREPLRRGRELFEILGERDALAALEVSEGHLANAEGRWSAAVRHWRRALQALHAAGTPLDVLHAAREIGDRYRDHGDSASARTHYAEALRIARDLGDRPVAEELERLLAAADGGSAPRSL